MGRAPCCEKVGLRRGRWSAEEDKILSNYIEANGEGSWRSLPKKAGLLRCGKSCRLRWINYLRCDVKRGNISKDEEDTIIKLHASIGNRWSLIASHLGAGRTDNEIKNYWNSHLSCKISPTSTTKRSSRRSSIKKKPLPASRSKTSSSSSNIERKQNINSFPHEEKELEEDCCWGQKALTTDDDLNETDDTGGCKDSTSVVASNDTRTPVDTCWEWEWDRDWDDNWNFEGLLEGSLDPEADENNINSSMLLSRPLDDDETTTLTPLTQVIADHQHISNTDSDTDTTQKNTQKKKEYDAIIAWLLS